MNGLNKKIKAFTLAEMLVVLVISALVMSITMLVLSLVQKQMVAMNKNYKNNTEIQLLERALVFDMNTHDTLFDASIQQLTCTSEQDTIVYHFNKDYALRNKDTLRVQISKTVAFLDGNPIKNEQIDALEIQFSKVQSNRKLFVYKPKDAAHYMNVDKTLPEKIASSLRSSQ